ncbi:hypothetical protein JR316_0004652 [Psilocybe cubensis]|uniref:Uncharacterized protein n=2 Tax=Psilocybe cubensis TaxID=181762 RepID=A0ACB8H4I8_PSICU|nr:hypothetical protein JR316_0004652 [Psilocybe cubensis]KAH9482552.1 hypothetical protein JR316_0004652 [Psilocybe cubensis]
MRVTRSATNKTTPRSEEENSINEDPWSEHDSDSLLTVIEDHLKNAQSELSKFKLQVEILRNEKRDLETELANVNALISRENMRKKSSRLSKTTKDADSEHELRSRIEELETENQKQKKYIAKLKKKALQDEVDDLLPKNSGKLKGKDVEVDSEHRMRKLLRCFSDLMMLTTLQDDLTQECPICFEKLQLKQCSAMQCQHLVCDECLPKISKEADDTVKCPECRDPTDRDDVEKVYMTEQQRWDELLRVARDWVKIDHRGEEETSEEEAEEEFIDDKTSSEVSSEGVNEFKSPQHTAFDVHSPCGDGDDHPPTSSPTNSRLFSESPTKEKRRRLEQLAEERANKRKR